MKKVLATIAILITISSCSFYKTAQSYVQKHCPKSYITDPTTGKVNVYYECDSLYPTSKLTDKCSKIEICFDATKAKITGTAVCDSLFDVNSLIQQVLHIKK